MSRFTDYTLDGEIRDIMERMIDRFPDMFEGFNTEGIAFITTKKKKSNKPLRLVSVSYPMEVFINKPYIVESYEARWKLLNPKQKNLAVFHIMCAIPEGGFVPSAKGYGKKVKPEITMYMREFAASGGVPNWMENPAAIDPMQNTEEKMSVVIPRIEALPEKSESKEDIKDVSIPTLKTPKALKESK